MQIQNYNIPYGVTLASPLHRLLAAFIDIIFIYGSGFLVLLVVILLTALISPEHQISSIFMVGICLFFIFLPFIFNLYYLEKYGQSIGKKILKIKILAQSGGIVSTDNMIMFRQIIPSILFHIPVLGIIFFFFDCILIFSKERQCFHDRMAKTIVIKLPK